MSSFELEVCVDTVLSAVNADLAGADRIELCSSLSEGGLTPSYGFLAAVKVNVTAPIFVMIRPRTGDFLYSQVELEIMKKDIVNLRPMADGFVFGILTRDGNIDVENCCLLADYVDGKEITFHRAIDTSRDPLVSLECIAQIPGVTRVLTSGGASTAVEGAQMLLQMTKKTGGNLTIMAGGGLSETNVKHLMRTTNVTAFHGSFRQSIQSEMTYNNQSVSMGTGSKNDFCLQVASIEHIRNVRNIIQGEFL